MRLAKFLRLAGVRDNEEDSLSTMEVYRNLNYLCQHVNDRFVAAPDSMVSIIQGADVRSEYWYLPAPIHDDMKFYGDCDDYALYCRNIFRMAGYRKGRLVLAEVANMGRREHLAFEYKGWILDSYEMKVNNREHLKWFWMSISGYQDGEPWRKIVG